MKLETEKLIEYDFVNRKSYGTYNRREYLIDQARNYNKPKVLDSDQDDSDMEDDHQTSAAEIIKKCKDLGE
jgi:hypothetical protein